MNDSIDLNISTVATCHDVTMVWKSSSQIFAITINPNGFWSHRQHAALKTCSKCPSLMASESMIMNYFFRAESRDCVGVASRQLSTRQQKKEWSRRGTPEMGICCPRGAAILTSYSTWRWQGTRRIISLYCISWSPTTVAGFVENRIPCSLFVHFRFNRPRKFLFGCFIWSTADWDGWPSSEFLKVVTLLKKIVFNNKLRLLCAKY